MEELVTEFNGKLADGLRNGQYFEIDVTTAKNALNFYITLATEKLNKHPETEKGLHIEVQLFDSKISATTKWGAFRSISFTDLGSNVKVIINISSDSFDISLNGAAQLQIPYSELISNWEAIQITGDIKAITRVDHRQILPTVWPASSCIPYYSDTLYFSNDIPVHFTPGHLMVITARCYGNANGNFYLNMKHAHNETLLMHMNVVFKTKTVYRGHLDPIHGDFFAQRFSANSVDGGFPFDFNRPFRIGIACKEHEFLIAVDGLYFCSFAYTDPENRHPAGIVPRPYTNALSNIVGVKIFSRGGAGIKVTEIDHIKLINPECTNFERYTKNNYERGETEQCNK